MGKQPKIKIEAEPIDYVLEIFNWAVILITWAITIYFINQLPETIPTHYNAAGEADAFGDRSNLWQLPIIATVTSFIVTVIERFPHVFNYPIEITEENAETQYRLGKRLMKSIKIGVSIVFGTLAYLTIQVGLGNREDLGSWFLALVFGITLLPVFYFLIKMSRNS